MKWISKRFDFFVFAFEWWILIVSEQKLRNVSSSLFYSILGTATLPCYFLQRTPNVKLVLFLIAIYVWMFKFENIGFIVKKLKFEVYFLIYFLRLTVVTFDYGGLL